MDFHLRVIATQGVPLFCSLLSESTSSVSTVSKLSGFWRFTPPLMDRDGTENTQNTSCTPAADPHSQRPGSSRGTCNSSSQRMLSTSLALSVSRRQSGSSVVILHRGRVRRRPGRACSEQGRVVYILSIVAGQWSYELVYAIVDICELKSPHVMTQLNLAMQPGDHGPLSLSLSLFFASTLLLLLATPCLKRGIVDPVLEEIMPTRCGMSPTRSRRTIHPFHSDVSFSGLLPTSS